MHETSLIPFLTVLASATCVATLCHYIHLPTIVGFIVAGVLIGPYGLQWVPSLPGVQVLTETGIIFLMFTIGLEFSFVKLQQLKRPFLGLGAPQVGVTVFLATLVAATAFGFPLPKAVFLGFLVSLSSTAIVMKLLEESREMASPYGQSTLGILLFQDLAVIPMVLLVPMLASQSTDMSVSWSGALVWFSKILAILGSIWIGSKVIVPFILNQVVRTRSREVFFFAVISLCFGIAFLVEKIGLSLSLGAFVAGVMISETPFVKQITADIVHLRDNFLGLFFTSVGMMLSPQFLVTHPLSVVGLSVFLFVGKASVIYGVARVMKFTHSVAAITALSLFQVGEFSFVLASHGLEFNILNQLELQYFLSASVVSMVLTPFAIKWAPRYFLTGADDFASVVDSDETRTLGKTTRQLAGKSHTLLVGFGPVGQDICKALKALEIPYRIVDMNHDVVKKFQKAGENILYGDASRDEILHAAGILDAKLVVVAVSGALMTRATLATVRRLRPDIHVIIRTQYLRELSEIELDDNMEVVVAEFETSVEMLVRTLRSYGIESEQIQRFVVGIRRQFSSASTALWESVRRTIELPAWDAISNIRPVRLAADSPAVRQTLIGMRLREMTGASVVCVFREGIGSTVPTGDFVFEEGDILHIIGSPDAVGHARLILRGESRNQETEHEGESHSS